MAPNGFWNRLLFAFGLQRIAPEPAPPRRSMQRSWAGAWAGAQINRLTADWITQPTSIDADVRSSARTLRARARQLRRDNPLAARFIQLQSENIVGPKGFGFQCRIPNTRNDTNEAASDAIEDSWLDWSQREYCTVDQKLCLTELLAAYVEMWKTDGESFLVMHQGFPNKYGFALQLVDPDQIDDDYNIAPADDRNEVRMGVEVDRWGREVAFHILTKHPGDWYGATNRIRERIPADRVLHRFTPLGAGQTRGITPFAPVMLRLQMLAGSQEALIILQRTAACKMGFLTVDPELAAPLQPTDEVDGEGNVLEQPPVIRWDAEPGRIEQLPRGYDFKNWDPGAPTPEYEVLRRSVAEEVAVGLGVSYASLTGDQSRANFGSQRVAMTSERDGYERDQQVVIGDVTRIVGMWGTAAMLKGAIKVPAFNVDALKRASDFQPRGFDWIDPEKDVNADLAAVNAGLDTLTNIAARRGMDYFENLKKRAREIAEAADLKVPIVLTPKAAQPPKPDDTATAADRAIAQIAESVRSTNAAVQWAVTNPPKPVVNVTTPDVRVDVKPPDVHVDAPITVNTPELRVNVEPAEVKAQIDVHLPRTGTREVAMKRDAQGKLIGAAITETA